jgi:hypothetical protein
MSESRMLGAAIVVTIVTATGFGCDRDRRTESSSAPAAGTEQAMAGERAAPTAIGGGPLEPEAAVSHIVKARCAREASCGFISSDAKWASEDACLEVVSREYGDDLTSQDCPDGVDGAKLSQCVDAARNADCGQAIDVIGRVSACRNSQLCANR